MIVAGIDPGTGSSSPLGLVVFDAETREIFGAYDIWPAETPKERRAMPLYRKIRVITKAVTEVLTSNPQPSTVYIESFVMRGKGGETLQRAIGGIMGCITETQKLREVANTRVKMIVGGAGSADKEAVAKGVAAYFSPSDESSIIIQDLIDLKAWDLLDAFAIAIAGIVTYEQSY